MGLLEDLKAKADANGDGKLDMADLESIKDHIPADQFEKLKAMADQNADGKITFDDLSSFNLSSLADDAQSLLGGLFGNKK